MSITTTLIDKVRLLPEWQQRRLLEMATQLEKEQSLEYGDDSAKERQERYLREIGRFAQHGITVSLETCQVARKEAWEKWTAKDDQDARG